MSELQDKRTIARYNVRIATYKLAIATLYQDKKSQSLFFFTFFIQWRKLAPIGCHSSKNLDT